MLATQGPENYGYCKRYIKYNSSLKTFEILKEFENSEKKKVETKINATEINNLVVHQVT